jgi:hypothetical protein
MVIHGEPTEVDKRATQAAREAGAEERREARGMKKEAHLINSHQPLKNPAHCVSRLV